jgi:AcrR family transcriptional regulator
MTEATRFDRRKQRTRQQLMDAAASLILEKGFNAVSIQDITDRADVGRGTFYLHFRDKEEVAAKLLQESFAAVEAQAPDLSALSIEQRDYLLFIGYFTHIANQRPLFDAIGTMTGTAAVASYIGDYMHSRAAQRLREQNIYPDVPQDIAAHFMTGALMQITSWWLDHTGVYTPQEAAAMFYRLQFRQPPPELGM